MGSLKHRNVLHRGLDGVAQKGIAGERDLIQRLWYVLASGKEQSEGGPTIHSMTETDRVIAGACGARALELTGAPLTNRGEILKAIEANRNEVSRVGRRLGETLGFEYPHALERTVRETWRTYVGGAGTLPTRVGKRLGAAAFLQDGEGKVLLVKHGYGQLNWELPGGAAEASESVADTATREVREETGLDVVAEGLTGIYYESATDSHHFAYRCRLTDPVRDPRPDHAEITECGYFAPDSLPRPLSDFTARRIRDALAGEMPALPVSIGPRQWLE